MDLKVTTISSLALNDFPGTWVLNIQNKARMRILTDALGSKVLREKLKSEDKGFN